MMIIAITITITIINPDEALEIEDAAGGGVDIVHDLRSPAQ